MPVERSANNKILAALPRSVRNHLLGMLDATSLPLRLMLETPGQPIGHVYFVETGLVSVVALSSKQQRIEVGLIGCECVTGMAVVLGSDSSANETMVQGAGSALRLSAGALREAMDRIPPLKALLLKFAHVFLLQASHTALSNGTNVVGERLARWILMANDRVAGNSLRLTHEFLAMMLAVRRPGVTHALHELEGRGLIKSTRGLIDLLDHPGLIELTNGSYGVPEAEYRRLIEGREPDAEARISLAAGL